MAKQPHDPLMVPLDEGLVEVPATAPEARHVTVAKYDDSEREPAPDWAADE